MVLSQYHPDPDVKFALEYQQGSLHILLDNECIVFDLVMR